MSGGIQILKHGSLFSGIGGFDLAAEWVGCKNIFHCEFNPFCQRVLKHYFPKALSYEDIRTTDFSIHKGNIDILTGGFPCQPYSLAGKRLGKEDERHLWPSMLRAIQEIRPGWVVAENVLGLVNWNDGVVFEEVQSDLEAEGYEVQPFILPAAGIDAPHRRERVWFIAYANGNGRSHQKDNVKQLPEEEREFSHSCDHGPASDTDHRKQSQQQKRDPKDRPCSSKPRGIPGAGTGCGDINRDITERVRQLETGACYLQKAAPDTGSFRCHDGSNSRQERSVQNDQRAAKEDQSERKRRERWSGTANPFSADTYLKGLEREASQRVQKGAWRTDNIFHDESAWVDRIKGWENFPQTQPSVRIGDDGLPDKLDFDTIFEGIPFPVKPITFSKWRTESIKALGNAIVPQVALQIFTAINKMTFNLNK